MAIYAPELARVQLIWTHPSSWPGEVAVNTFHLRHQHHSGNAWDWETEIQDLPARIAGKLDDHWTALRAMFVGGAHISAIKAYQLDTAGLTVAEGFFNPTATRWEGSGTSGMLPAEVALCQSFYGYQPGTFAQNRARKRGRIYLPYLAVGLLNDAGMLRTDLQASFGTALQAFWNDIQGMHSSEDATTTSFDSWDLVVASSVDGTASQVEAIALDNHFDSQRRRQNRTPATRSSWTITHAD